MAYLRAEDYHHYYNQVGSGHASPFYQSSVYLQRGRGFGSFVSSIWNAVRPLLWSGAKAVGNQILSTGGRIMGDLASSNDKAKDLKTIALNRLEEGVGQLGQKVVRKMTGGGRPRRRKAAARPVKRRRRRPRPTPTPTRRRRRRRPAAAPQRGAGLRRAVSSRRIAVASTSSGRATRRRHPRGRPSRSAASEHLVI